MSEFQQFGLRHPISRITTSGGTTTLINTSNTIQYFDGTTTQTVVLPDATTMKSGRSFYVANRSTGTITIKDNSSTTLKALPSNTDCWINPIDVSTSAGLWDISQGLGGDGGGSFAFSHITIAGLASNYANPGGDADIIYDTAVYDPDGAFNTSNGHYAVQQSGFILVSQVAQTTAAASVLELKKNGTIYCYLQNSSALDSSGAILIQVTAGDILSIGSQSAATFTGNSPYVNLVSFCQIPNAFAASKVIVSVGNGFGSTNTKIRRFSNTDVNTGTDITYADSATLGGSFTINSAGAYAITVQDLDTASQRFVGISKNTTNPTQSINAVPLTERLLVTVLGAVNSPDGGSWTGRLAAGDVIRHHDDGGANGTDFNTSLSIERIG